MSRKGPPKRYPHRTTIGLTDAQNAHLLRVRDATGAHPPDTIRALIDNDTTAATGAEA